MTNKNMIKIQKYFQYDIFKNKTENVTHRINLD